MKQYFKIGKIVAAHGVNGDLLLKHDLGKKTSLKGLKALFIEERKDSMLPWFITSTKIKSEDEVILQLDTIDTREKAKKLIQKEVWLTEEDFKRLAAKKAPASMLGYMIIDDKKELGEIKEVIEQPHQLLCRLEINEKEVLIPLNEQTIQKIDHKKSQVFVKLPEGLLEIYLGVKS